MSFEHKHFPDGDSTYRLPAWKQVVDEIHDDLDAFDYSEERIRRQTYQANEIGLKHPKNGSFVRIKDDGTIEAFTEEGTGIRIKTDSLQVFSDHIQIIGYETQISSSPNASRIGHTPLDGAYPVSRQKGMTDKARELIEGGHSDAL